MSKIYFRPAERGVPVKAQLQSKKQFSGWGLMLRVICLVLGIFVAYECTKWADLMQAHHDPNWIYFNLAPYMIIGICVFAVVFKIWRATGAIPFNKKFRRIVFKDPDFFLIIQKNVNHHMTAQAEKCISTRNAITKYMESIGNEDSLDDAQTNMHLDKVSNLKETHAAEVEEFRVMGKAARRVGHKAYRNHGAYVKP